MTNFVCGEKASLTALLEIMDQLPNPDNLSLGAPSRLPGRSVSGAQYPRSIQTPLRTCIKNTPLFRNRYHPDKHYIVPVNSAMLSSNILKHRTCRHSLRHVIINKWGWQTSNCMWNHVCHLRWALNFDEQGKHTSTNGTTTTTPLRHHRLTISFNHSVSFTINNCCFLRYSDDDGWCL